MTGTGAELNVSTPDGSIEVSEPPGAGATRAGTTEREPPGEDSTAADDAAAVPWDVQPEQLTLA